MKLMGIDSIAWLDKISKINSESDQTLALQNHLIDSDTLNVINAYS